LTSLEVLGGIDLAVCRSVPDSPLHKLFSLLAVRVVCKPLVTCVINSPKHIIFRQTLVTLALFGLGLPYVLHEIAAKLLVGFRILTWIDYDCFSAFAPGTQIN